LDIISGVYELIRGVTTLNLNELSLKIVDQMIERKAELRIEVMKGYKGATLIDIGVNTPGSYESGLMAAKIGLGGLGLINLRHAGYGDLILPEVFVALDFPALATLGVQFAMWRIDHGSYSAIASGPSRLLIRDPPDIYEMLGYEEQSDKTVVLLEGDGIPPKEVVKEASSVCRINPDQLYFVLAPANSVAGATQIASRATEVAVLSMYRLGYNVAHIYHSTGTAPVPPVHPDSQRSVGRSNDGLLHASRINLSVKTDDDAEFEKLQELLPKTVSSTSNVHNAPFYDIYEKAEFQFANLPAGFFRVAEITLNDIRTGKIIQVGKRNIELYLKSIGYKQDHQWKQ
jgi:methenyltetrahydromethanopterin cyclohydrolase